MYLLEFKFILKILDHLIILEQYLQSLNAFYFF